MEIDMMKLKSNLAIKGTLRLSVTHKDGSVDTFIHDNLLTTSGLAILAELLANTIASGIANIAAGSGTTAATENDVALESEYTRASVTINKLTGVDSNKVLYTAIFPLGGIVGGVTEAGMFTSTQLFNRAVFTAIPLLATDLLVINWTIEFKNV